MQTKTQNSVNAALAAVHTAPDFYLSKVANIGNKFARVVGTIRASATPDQLIAAVRKLNPRFSPVQGSFTAIASNGITTTYEGLVGSLTERVVLTDENRAGFKAIASNMYMDCEEKLWSMVKTEAGDVLISSHAADEPEIMKALMQSVASSNVGADVQQKMSEADAIRAQIKGGDLVTFVSESGAVQMGFVVAAVANADGSDAGLSVVTQLNEDVHMVDRNMVVAFVDADSVEGDEQAEMEAVAAGSINMDMIANYYRRVFARRPEYFEAFMQRFRSHVFA